MLRCAIPNLLLEIAHHMRPDVDVRFEEPLDHPGLVGLLAVDLEGLVLGPAQKQLAHELQREVHGQHFVGPAAARCRRELLQQERLDRQHGLTAEYAVPPACGKEKTQTRKPPQ